MDKNNKTDSTGALLHDLKGPVQNAKQFTMEIRDAVVSVQSIIESNPNGLDVKHLDLIKDLMLKDFQPCLKYLSESIDLLESRIRDYENL